MTRIRATLLAAAVLAGAAFGPASFGVSDAGAAFPHRAMVVVDTGGTRYEKVVTFTSDSITGLRALELAGATPVVYSFSGQGGAVCRLFGIGRDASPNCLGGADGDNRYWAYFRAPAGSASYTYSRAGAGSTQVHDGDVEGWRFGTGAAPGYVALPPIATTTTAPPVAPPKVGGPSVPGPTNPGAGPAPAAAPDPAAPVDPAALAAFVAAANGSPTTAPAPGEAVATAAGSDREAATQVEAERAKRAEARTVSGDTTDDDGGAGSLVIFAVIAAALIGGGLLLRRSRARPVP
jgi:hypothetical protein